MLRLHRSGCLVRRFRLSALIPTAFGTDGTDGTDLSLVLPYIHILYCKERMIGANGANGAKPGRVSRPYGWPQSRQSSVIR